MTLVGYRCLTRSLGIPFIINSVVHKLSELQGWFAEEAKTIVLRNFLRLVSGDEQTIPCLGRSCRKLALEAARL